MTDETILRWFPVACPFFFAGIWLTVTIVNGLMSGWFNLQQWYADDRDERPLLKLRWQSGTMGFGANFNRVLTLAACRSGLSIRVPRIFGPFQKPLLIPWSEIEASEKRSFFMKMVRLDLGKPSNGKLILREKTWAQLVDAAKEAIGTAEFPVSSG